MRVVVFTTSYPRDADDYAGRFVADAVEQIRREDVEVDVVSPGVYRHFGLAGGDGAGLVGNIRQRPWLAPLLLLSMLWTLRRHARNADLVHAHWLASTVVARFCGKPFVVTLHGSGSAGRFEDMRLVRNYPGFVRWLLRKARAVICVSEPLADAVRSAGVDNVVFVPVGIDLPERVSEPLEPPRILYAGRLAPEKDIATLAEAANGLPLVVAGDGPDRPLLPQALGFVPHADLCRLYSECAIFVLTSKSEGLPVSLREAMAYRRPVIATPVGGIPSLVRDGENGLLVPVGDVAALRASLERLLADRALRERLGAAARETIESYCSWPVVTARTLEVYRQALSGR